MLALVSLLVLTTTGYAYGRLTQLNNGLATDPVIDHKSAPKPLDGAVDILLVGLDSRTDAQGNPLPAEALKELHAGEDSGELNTDSMIMLHVPVEGNRAMGVSLPRDSYVDIADGIKGKHKLNSAYARGRALAANKLRSQGVTDKTKIDQDSRTAGRKTLIHTVEQLTGQTIDHYAEVNLASFYVITKAVGGVEVCLKAPVKEANSGIDLPAGRQTIEGAQALAFVRQRYKLPRGDLDRVVRQQAFLSGLARKMLSGGMLVDPNKLTNLINAINKSVLLDQGWDVAGFAAQMQGLTGGNIHFETMPTGTDLNTPEDGLALTVDPQKVREFIKKLTSDQAQPKAQQSQLPQQTAASTIDVQNGSGTAKLAANVLDYLVRQGFGKGEATSAGSTPKSAVHYAKGAEAAGNKVATALGGLTTVEDGNVPAGHVKVLLGKDYAGPGVPHGITAAPAAFNMHTRMDTRPLMKAAPHQADPGGNGRPAQTDGPTCIN